jgi:hypothetical protein
MTSSGMPRLTRVSSISSDYKGSLQVSKADEPNEIVCYFCRGRMEKKRRIETEKFLCAVALHEMLTRGKM